MSCELFLSHHRIAVLAYFEEVMHSVWRRGDKHVSGGITNVICPTAHAQCIRTRTPTHPGTATAVGGKCSISPPTVPNVCPPIQPTDLLVYTAGSL